MTCNRYHVLLAVHEVCQRQKSATCTAVAKQLGKQVNRTAPDLISAYNRGWVTLGYVTDELGRQLVYTLTDLGLHELRVYLEERLARL